MTKFADAISGNLTDYDIEYRIHTTRRMFQRNIHETDIELVLKEGHVIERYDEDFPLPSVLISGRTSANRPLHLVAGVNVLEQKLVIITAYEPDPLRWMENFSFRRAE
ncbi:MAG: hypothetical protein B6245_13935 [Desulfobacteraceae bacterium 4572_88]|nr:MAG: hypothetical protein B6245_13935 [Desulfobacteraceae bacterium 4572_88]